MTIIQVGVTFCAWQVNIFGDKESSVTLQEHIDKGATFEHLLNHLVASYPALTDTLIHPATQQLNDDIIVIINGKFLDLVGGLQTQLRHGDNIQFLPVIPGG